MTENERYAARCLCGAVRFEVEAPTLWCAHCHCTLCQRAHGAGVVTWVGAAVERVRFLDGEDTLRWYRSSVEAERGFCGHCGTTLFFRSQRWPGELHVVRTAFEDEIDRRPSVHVYWETHVDWLTLGDALPRRASEGS